MAKQAPVNGTVKGRGCRRAPCDKPHWAQTGRVSLHVYLWFDLSMRTFQNASSFGNSLSRFSIFRQVTLSSSVYVCMCICVCVWAFGSLRMSGCSILRQQPVKMFHLSSGDPFVLCVCVRAFGSSCMSGCFIIWQQPVKMFHLSSGDPFVLCVYYMCVCLGVWVLVYVRMLHPLAIACQDAPSFVR